MSHPTAVRAACAGEAMRQTDPQSTLPLVGSEFDRLTGVISGPAKGCLHDASADAPPLPCWFDSQALPQRARSMLAGFRHAAEPDYSVWFASDEDLPTIG